jgi:AsmA protein
MARLGKKPPAAPEPAPAGSLKQILLGWYGVVGMGLGYVLPFKPPFAEGYAKEYWRQALGSLLLVLALIGGLVGLTFYLLDANDFKGQIVDYVKANKQRELVLEGDLQLTFFPQLGLDTGKMSLSQRNSTRKFAAVDNARLYIAWWPLLLKRLQVERVVLDGLHADVVRHADGSSNFDDLLVSAEQLGGVEFAVEKVRLLRGHVSYRDEAAGLGINLQDLELETGRLANATAGRIDARFHLLSSDAQLDARVRLNGDLLYEHATQLYQLNDFEARAQGLLAGQPQLDLDLRGSLSARPALRQLGLDKLLATVRGLGGRPDLETRLSAHALRFEVGQWRGSALRLDTLLPQPGGQLQLTWDMPAFQTQEQKLRAENLQLTLALKRGETSVLGQFNSPLSLDLSTRQLQLPTLQGSWSANDTLLAGKLNAKAQGQLQADWGKQDARLNFKTQIDDSEFSGDVQLQDFKTPAWTFDVAATRLDLDRYLVSDWPARLQASTQVQDWRVLQGLNLRGRLQAQELRAARLQASAFSASLRAAAGTLNIEPVEAQLYGGSLQGELSLGAIADVTGPASAVQVSTRQKFSGVQFDPLLALLRGGEGRLSGKGQLTLELQAQGADLTALRQSLTGTASLALARGTLAGLDLPEALLDAREQLGQEGAVQQDRIRLTQDMAYNDLKASWQFSQGQARSTDLLLRTPTLNCKGEATYNVENGQLEAELSAQVLPGLRRATSGELADLAGISVPLQISGPWATAEVHLRLGEASGTALAALQKTRQARVTPGTAVGTTETSTNTSK